MWLMLRCARMCCDFGEESAGAVTRWEGNSQQEFQSLQQKGGEDKVGGRREGGQGWKFQDRVLLVLLLSANSERQSPHSLWALYASNVTLLHLLAEDQKNGV